MSRLRDLEIRFADYRNLSVESVWFRTVGDKERAAEKVKEAIRPLEELKKVLES